MLKRFKSEAAYSQLCETLPGGTNAPARAARDVEQLPMIVEKAVGELLIDVDGNTFVDFCCSWGALILGHAHPKIIKAAAKRMTLGTTFGITSEIEGRMARKTVSLVDSIDKIRFISSGTEAAMSAARLARGFTGRDIIVKFDGNYHGHSDIFMVPPGSGINAFEQPAVTAGIPKDLINLTLSLPYNDEKSCKEILLKSRNRSRIAAVILEPIAANMGVVPAKESFLKMLREVTKEIGALLIFDEVITGFRLGLGGAQELIGIKPDLTLFGKIIGGGFPVAAFGGSNEVMNYLAPLGPVYQAGTLSGNPVGMEAGFQTLSLLEKMNFYQNLEKKTQILTAPIQEYLLSHPSLQVCLQEKGSMFTLFFGTKEVKNREDSLKCDGKMFAKFFRYLFENGVYIPPKQHVAWFVSSVHTAKSLRKTRDLVLNFLKSI